MAREVAEDSLGRSPGGTAAWWAGVEYESLTQATDPVSGQGGGGCDSEMPDSC